MGGLTSFIAPALKSSSKRTVQQPVASPPPPAALPVATGPTEAELEAKRVEDVLRRARGQSSTVHTSFRGLLTPETAQPARKTLLGE
ncbi:MAG: hypothetical protein V4621_00215 [Pseudomonadota bacterium]